MTNYWKSVASVLTGSAVAQIIPILGSLVIARQFAPSVFGEFSAWLGIVLLLAILLPCRFEMALAIEEDGAPRRAAVVAILVTASLVSCMIAVLLAIGLMLFPFLLDEFPFILIVVWLPTGLAIAVANIWQSWAASEGSYRQLSIMRVTQATAVTLLQITVGFFHPSASNLAIAQFLGVIFAIAVSAHLLPLGRSSAGQIAKSIVPFWLRHIQFLMYSMPAGIINTAAAQLPIVIVASRFGADVAGLLAMTIKVIGAPSGLLGKSVLDVFKRHAASGYKDRGECRKEYSNTFKILLLGAFIFSVTMYFISESLFLLAFGNKWREAGVMAVWLLPLFALRFVASPLSYMVYIAGKQRVDLAWQIGLLMTTVVGLCSFKDYPAALKNYSLMCSALYAIYILMSYRFSLGNNKSR